MVHQGMQRHSCLRSAPALRRYQEIRYGRELSAYGIKEFVNIQTVWIARTGT
jgi:hypothetical protein